MSASKPQSTPFEASADKLADLVQELTQEPFAVENQIVELSLGSIEVLLEETRERWDQFGRDDLSLLGTPEIEASFHRCLELYCAILLELETENAGDTSSETLAELRERRNSTRLILIHKPEHADHPEEALAEKIVEETPLETLHTSSEPAEEPSMPPELTLISPLLKNETREFELPFAPLAPPATPSSSVSEPVAEKGDNESSMDLVSIDANSSDYLALSDFLTSLTEHPAYTLSPIYLEKLASQALCSALETETTQSLMIGVRSFWAIRNVAVSSLLEASSKKFDLHPSLREVLTRMVAENPGWAYEDKAPIGGILNSLRYIVGTVDVDRFRPAPIDLATLLFFFGQDANLGGLNLSNHLGIHGLEPNETSALAFTFFRIHKLRQKAQALGLNFSKELREQIQQEVESALQLVRKIQVNPPHHQE